MVEIEALFVELTLNDNRMMGADWTVMKEPLQFQKKPQHKVLKTIR